MSENTVKVLLIEDVPHYASLLQGKLAHAKGASFAITWAERVPQALDILAGQDPGHFDIILLDLSLADSQGMETFTRLRSECPHMPIIVLSSLDDEDIAVRAVHEGAQDYLVRGEIDPHLLARSIRYAIERKRSEVAMLEAEEKYRGIFENTVEGIFQTSADGRYLSANPALARIYGYDSPEELKRELTDIGGELYVLPGRRNEFIRLMELNDVVAGFESQIRRRDKSVIWISENVRAVRDKAGRLLCYEGTVEDITERKKTEQNLLNSEALYHSLVENLPQNIFRKNLAEQFTFANKRFCETLGKTLDEIVGKTDFDFFPPELASKYQKDDHLIMETGKLFETIEEHRPPGGEHLYVNVVKTPLYDAQGKIIGLQGIFWDITEKKRAEERIRQAGLDLAKSREELRAKNEQMEDDLRMAREIQQAILPQQYPSFPKGVPQEQSALRFLHRYLPNGAVGGDFFNILALSDTKAGVFICDVMGHGVRSALVTAILRALVEELTRLAADPGELLGQINRDLRAILQQSGTPMYTTAFYMVADLETKELCYANAGHPKPMIVRRQAGKTEFLKNASGRSSPALGLREGTVYPTSKASLEPGDFVMLYTDGLYDVERAGELLDPDWVLAAVQKRMRSPGAVIFDDLLAEIKNFSEAPEFCDDVCMVGMEVAKLP